jgi:lysophospholipase L1-like esterase
VKLTRLSTMKRPAGRRLRLATVVAVTATASVGLGAGPVRAATPATSSGNDRGVYLALGDSVAFGYRPPAVTPPAAYLNPHNFSSYADYTAKATGLRLVNASCPGETTVSMKSATAPDFGCRRYRSLAPLHTSYSGTQLEYALRFLRTHPTTRLVTVSIGANDLFLCLATSGCQLPSAVAQAAENLAKMLRSLRTEGYRGTIVTLTYYKPAQAPIRLVTTLNAALAAATRPYGGEVANGLAAFRAAARHLGGDPCRTGLLIALPGGSCDVHPTSAGHLVLAVPVTLAYLQGRAQSRLAA